MNAKMVAVKPLAVLSFACLPAVRPHACSTAQEGLIRGQIA